MNQYTFFCKLRVHRHEGAFGLFCQGQVTERLKVRSKMLLPDLE